ncbi:sulfurtransferase TusA family protein [Roseicitreum antarcticum]|uniref:tRNA 2-thiouridine synthesizing protein A n=1 Tax=Roseicitreum antarcticum TaxID=564137 RepID=A0A1H3A4X0_9RHOB|nr:sulfurtransferase TusA family protein [Roseicitreum antarcticum]SDX23989.1 tRNA 2-thiouridine synthesizing protein A [Roseicitreum antarcticum]
MENDTAWHLEVDATGLLCPLPVLRARKALQAMAPGQVLRLLASDPVAVVDIPHFCAEAGHGFEGMQPLGDPGAGAAMAYLIRKDA